MTVAELKQALSKYPDDMEVTVDIGLQITSIDRIIPFIMDGNMKSIVVCSSYYWHSKEKNIKGEAT